MQSMRPDWAGGNNMPGMAPAGAPKMQNVMIDVNAFTQTRDALTSSLINLSAAVEQAYRAYQAHTNVVLKGDAPLDLGHLVNPFNMMQPPQQMMAQMALQQNGGAPPQAIAPMLTTSQADAPPAEEEAGDGKKKRKKRAYKQRDPNAPKRPLTAYFRYLGEMRPVIQAEMNAHPENFNTSGKPGDIARIATDRWNELTADKQEPYKKAYQAELKDYEKAIAAYKAAGGIVDASTVDASAAGAEKPAAAADDSDDSSDSDEEDAKPAPPPAAPTPKKSAIKKGRGGAPTAGATIATPAFNSVNDNAASAQLQAETAKSSSPSKKRKSAADASAEAEGTKKKRSRKSKAEEVVAAPDPPAAPPASSPPTESGKKKKDKKKKKGD